ncbi:MAG: heptosyltransferase [Pirellulaceae bacterium]|nr:MAG: heptosyltransferase [Pirellulaceae bacterium]
MADKGQFNVGSRDGQDRLRVAIVRLSAIGDCVLTLPLLCALRQALPEAHVAWVVEPAAAPLLVDHDALDEVVVFPRRWMRCRQGWKQCFELRRKRFDLVIDPQGLLKSALIGYLAGVPVRIGFDKTWAREGSHWFYSHTVRPVHRHVVDAQRELVRRVASHIGPVEFRMPVYHEERQRMQNWIDQFCSNSEFVVVHVGASWASRRWLPGRWAELARMLVSELRRPVVAVWGNTDERRWAEDVVRWAGGGVYLAPPTTLREMAALVSLACLAVAGDSGPLHIAAAYGVPVVGLYGVTRCEVSGPYGTGHVAIQVSVPPLTAGRRRKDVRWIQKVHPQLVLGACRRVLESRKLPGPWQLRERGAA